MLPVNGRENGSVAMVAMVAMVALSLATLYVRNSSDQLNQSMKAAKLLQQGEIADVGLMNGLATFKAKSSPARVGSNRYIPQLYATNYYAKEWRLIDRSTRQPVTNIFVPRADLSTRVAVALMQGASQSRLRKTPLAIKVLRANPNRTNPILVDSIDIQISRPLANNSRTKQMTARIAIAKPQPTGVQIWYRKKDIGTFALLEDEATLSGGPFDFEVRGSGVIFDAAVKIDGTEVQRVGGFQPGTQQIRHAATSYAAVDIPLGAPFSLELLPSQQADSKKPPLTAAGPPPLVFDQAKCKFREVPPTSAGKQPIATPSKATVVIEAIAYGPDPSISRTTGKLTIHVPRPKSEPGAAEEFPDLLAGGDGPKAVKNYSKVCNKECPFIDDTSGADAVVSTYGRKPALAGETGMYLALALNVTKYKVCLDYSRQVAGVDTSVGIVMFDPKTCKKTVLFKPNAWPGCELSI